MLTSDKIKFNFDFIDHCICNAWVAVAVGGSALIGGMASMYGANKAADAQTNATNKAADTQMAMYNKTREDLSPYRDIGIDASGRMKTKLSELTSPISVNPDDFQNSDYFKFAMQQGQKGVTNSAAARGLASSGAALKGAAAFAKGLATDTYKTAFDMANTNQTNAYNRLISLIQAGGNAAAGTGQLGEKAAYNTGQALIGGGNAQAAAANSIGGSIANMSNTIGGFTAYKGLYGGNSGGNNSTPSIPSGVGFGSSGEYYGPLGANA